MQMKSVLTVALAGGLVLTSCSKLGDLSADNFTVTPSPLEAVGNEVPVTINGRFPEKWMKKKAVVAVTPVLRFEGGEVAGNPAVFQGEKVQGNDQEIAYKVGGSYTMKDVFKYQPEMIQSKLYLTFKARVGKKEVEIPEVHVADGVISTSDLLKKTVTESNTALGADAYQYAIAQSKEAQIKYLINQARVRSSELKSVSVQEFVQMLREIKADSKGFQLENIEISAYASPEGSLKFNTELAEKRQETSADYVQKQLKELEMDTRIDEKYTAEDWEGFSQLVQASNMQDKDVILRVLSMYPDPEQREQEIRKLSAAFAELADEILPELRRARLTINYNLIGRTDAEIKAQYKQDAAQLSVEEMLYSATLTEDVAQKQEIYAKTAQLYPNDYRAYNNLATLAFKQGDLNAAKNYLAKAAAINAKAAEVNANQALLAVAEGKMEQAQQYLSRATGAANYNEVLGTYNLAKGNFQAAAQNMNQANTNSAALAQILNKNYAAAAKTLEGVKDADATTHYLKAVVAARANQVNNAIGSLKKAFELDPSLKERAAKDLEFAALFSNANFQGLVK